MHDIAGRAYAANLVHLPAATRAALCVTTGPTLRADPPAYELMVSMPDGAWVPMHPSGDPVGAAHALVRTLLTAGPPPLIVIVGLGAGFVLDALEAAGNESTKILAIEPVPALTRLLLMRRDCAAWLSSGRLTLLVGPDYQGIADAWRAFPSDAMPPTIITPLVDRHFPVEAARARTLLRELVAGVQANAAARRQFAGRYLTNTLANLPSIVSEGDAGALAGAFAGTPAFVVGAGPSLDLNLRALERLQHRAIVVAVDTALRPLVAAGIRPHLVIGVDPSELNARHLQHLPDVSGVWLVAEGSLDPSVFMPFVGRTFTFCVSDHEPWPWLRESGLTRGSLRAWGSVLTTAFDLACRMGCDPIVFAGADLAYSRGLQYCRNTTYEPDWRDYPDDRARAERFKSYLATRPARTETDVHGRPILTAPPYVQFRDWIVARARELTTQRVWNATGDGILHGGSIDQVDDVVERLEQIVAQAPAQERLRALWASHRSPHSVLAQLDRALHDPTSIPVSRWQAFAGDKLSPDDLRRAVEAAAVTIRAQAA